MTLTFQPGQRLQESSLADWLGMSRTPVREAMWRLQSDGLIESNSTGGAVVTELSIADIENTYLVIEMLEGLASRLAAERLSRDDAAKMEATLEQMRAAATTGDVETWIRLDADLHNLIRAIAANPKLSQLASQVNPIIERVRSTYLREGAEPDRLEVLTAQHCMMGEAILAGEPDRAEALTRQLFSDARRDNVRLLGHWVSPLRRSF